MLAKNRLISIKYCILGIAILLSAFALQAQITSIGTPFIKNYSRTDYLAGQQNWMIEQCADGRLYFANNEGVLEFDGLNWNLITLPKKIIVRSVLAAEDGRIYVGGFNELGFFEADSNGKLAYHSLMGKLGPDDKDFDEIWRIHQTPDGLVFQSFTQIMILHNNTLKVIKAPGKFHFSYYVNGQLIIVDIEAGILRYSMGNFFPLVGTEALKGIEIWAILPYGNKFLLATSEKGIYIYDGNILEEWSNPSADILKQQQVYTAIRINSDLMAFGSIQNGLLICTNEGIPVQNINIGTGLQNNTILSIKQDNVGNLWLGTDNGIDFLEISSPLSMLSYEHGIGAGYTAALHNGILYLGTNQGVFYKKWEEFLNAENRDLFHLIEDTKGQVWSLQVIDDHLFCGNTKGTFIIEGTSAKQISDIPGGWTYVRMPHDENKIIGGTYSGLILFKKENNKWTYANKIRGFNESSRLIEVDRDGSVWMSHGFKGVFHLLLNNSMDSVKQVNFYNSLKGFKSEFGINLAKIKNDIIFVSTDGIYKFNSDTDSFEKNQPINDQFNFSELSKLEEDKKGNIWYFAHNNFGVMRMQEDGGYTNINLPFKQINRKLIGGFEFVYPIDEQNVLIGSSNGFIHYDPNQYKNYLFPFSAYINKVSLLNLDSNIYAGHGIPSDNNLPVLDFKNNALSFSFSANDFENSEQIKFSTFLEGYDDGWSGWEVRKNREFTNLYEGDYTFNVKAQNIYGVETKSVIYKFTIKPPWERTSVAYIIYALFGLLLLGFALFWVRNKIERSKQIEKRRQLGKFKEREEKMHRESLESEKEIIRLRNEKLSEQMRMKDKELANSTLDMIQKNKLLTKIKNDLKRIVSNTGDEELKNEIHVLTRKINKELDTEKQWKVFESHFESVHEAFLKRLKIQYPDLSPRELKLCAYLRLNISSKEISVLMNISTRVLKSAGTDCAKNSPLTEPKTSPSSFFHSKDN